MMGTTDAVVMGNVMLFVVNGPALVEAGLTYWAWRPGAVSADVNWLATGLLVEVVGTVLLA